MLRRTKDPKRWAVVLAGGEGERMRPAVERWLGSHRPKQYCAFDGGRTMIEHAWERALDAAPPERILTVIDRSHRRFLGEFQDFEIPGGVVEQPRNLDTGPGVFLPLSYVLQRDPGAYVAFLPSDHFIHPREKFSALLDSAFRLAQFMPERLMLLAAIPDRPEPEYGWIAPKAGLRGSNATPVEGFREKPKLAEALDFYLRGGLWNTMIAVARASTLWNLARELEPEMMSRFEALRGSIATPKEAEALSAAYEGMKKLNFSKDILEKAAGRIIAMPMAGISWSDWGRPERVVESLKLLGKEPEFFRAMAQGAMGIS